MGNWKIIIPTATTNLCINPSIELGTTGWPARGGAAVGQSSAFAKFGVYSLEVVCGAGAADGCSFSPNIAVSATTDYTVSVWVYAPAAGVNMVVRVACDNSGDHDETFTTAVGWQRIENTFTTDGVDASINDVAVIKDTDATVITFYVDALLVEEQSEVTTYCDGDQPGCAWNGAAHASTSTRSAAYRGGGFVRDLKDDYSFAVESAIGVGMPPVTLSHDSYSLLPGGELNGVKTEIRPFTLAGNIQGAGDPCSIHPPRNVLEKIFAHDTYPESGDGWQPVRLRYTGAAVIKEADAHYARGLEGALTTEALQSKVEKVAIGFEQDDPFWAAVGDGTQLLDSNDGGTVLSAVARLKSTGQWSALGAAVGAGPVFAITGDDTYVYFGGSFTNWYGDANADRIVRYDQSTATWSALATGLPNGQINDMAVGPDGTLYIVGTFLNAGGDANADFIAQWNGAAFSAVGIPNTGTVTTVESIRFDLDGNLWVGGNFTNLAGIANADYIAYWDGAAWNAPAVGADGIVYALATHPNGDMYAAGAFANIGGVAAVRIAFWDGTAWAALSTGLDGNGLEMAFAADNSLYVVGAFTTAGGATVNYVTSWNGTAFSALGAGLNAQATAVNIGPDGVVYVGGDFTTAGSLTDTDDVALWNGSSWAHLDLLLGGVAGVRAIYTERPDPVIATNYNIWLGSSTAAASTWAGLVTATNDGNTPTYPVFIVSCSGGEAKLKTLRNETTGLGLLLDYKLLDGETLTIDLNPQAKTIISSMFGERPDAMLAGSDFGEWSLLPGGNEVTCYINVIGVPTVTAYLIWKTLYKGVD